MTMQRQRQRAAAERARGSSSKHSPAPPSSPFPHPSRPRRLSLSLTIVLVALSLSRTGGRATAHAVPGGPSKDGDGDVDDALATARRLVAPAPNASADGEFEAAGFWEDHGDLLRAAWSSLALELSGQEDDDRALPPLTGGDVTGGDVTGPAHRLEGVLRPEVVAALVHVHADPTAVAEASVRSLFDEVAPDVYRLSLFTPEGIAALRAHLDLASRSGIPTRRPNGMNRHGLILDREVDGAVSTPHLTSFVDSLVEGFIRPVGRMLFSSQVGDGDDSQYFAFTIRYKEGEDVKLNEHSDASVVTMNVNLNLPGEGYGGSSVYFVDDGATGERTAVRFEPGVALVHRGAIRHGAPPIVSAGDDADAATGGSSGSGRHNLIVWLFGEDGYVRVAPHPEGGRLTVKERWGRREPRGSGRGGDCDEGRGGDCLLSNSGSASFSKDL